MPVRAPGVITLGYEGEVGETATVLAEGMTKMPEPLRDAYECPDGWFEVRDDAGPHRWIATRNPVKVKR